MAAHVRDHSTAMICFMQKCWLNCFNVTLVATYSETDSVKFSSLELHFQTKVCKVFAENIAALLWRPSFRMSNFAKDS